MYFDTQPPMQIPLVPNSSSILPCLWTASLSIYSPSSKPWNCLHFLLTPTPNLIKLYWLTPSGLLHWSLNAITPCFFEWGAMLWTELCLKKTGNITTVILFQWENIVYTPTNKLQLIFDSVYSTPNLYPVKSKSCDYTSISLIFPTTG